ncbi:T-cell immunoglobulin and mucin domain-containing protein 4-like [Osmerus eperlanus]|uniref:T-cell immunoglobulin and mucin domain-containing protein 4-like n=1 Tax=Osmerus eperlanus TaxID=29151 RepID=UPI002E164A4C
MFLLCCLLSALIRVSTPCQSSLCLVGVVGQNITLPCWYNRHSSGILNVCWGRETLPAFKCSGTIVSIQGGRVTDRSSPRYVLLSGREEGNVSLTILHARESDSGVYGCRVEIPGWFNDLKINIHLTMDSDSTLQHESDQKSVAVVSARLDPITMSTARPRDKVQEILTLGVESDSLLSHQGQQKVTVLLMHSAKTAAIFLIPLAAILVFILGRWRRQRLEMTPGQEENIYEDMQSFARQGTVTSQSLTAQLSNVSSQSPGR